jgi:hypothetical protein
MAASSITPLSILGSAASAGASSAASAMPTVLGFAQQQASANGSAGSGGLFGAIAGAANTASAIHNILTAAQTQQSKTGIYNSLADYLTALQTGQIKPTATWQTNAAYLQQTGQPFVVSLDSTGQPQVTPQAQADLSKYTPPQQKQLAAALAAVATMAQKIQANQQNQSWVDTLASVEPGLQEIRAGQVVPAQGWQTEAADFAATGVPFKVGLDAKGNVIAENQFAGQFPDANQTDLPTLRAAAAQLQSAMQTGITPLAWEAQAYVYAQQGQDYFLAVDDVTGNIVVKTNSADNITPSFLKTAPYPDIGAGTPWLQHAATLIAAGTGFYLDVGGNGQMIVRQNNGQGINTWNQPRNQAVQNPIVNLLA